MADPGPAGKRARGAEVKAAAMRLLGPARFGAARAMYRTINGQELRAPFPLGLKLRAWRDGFTAGNAALYGFANAGSGTYVSDYTRDKRTSRINPITALFDHKLLLHHLLATRGVRQAEVVAFVSRHGAMLDPLGAARYVSGAELTAAVVAAGGRYIWKPENGGRGLDVALLEVADGQVLARRGADARPFKFPLPRAGAFLLERAIEQHAFWQTLSPTSVNTMRILTMWTPGDAAPFVARAVQRVGTRATLPTDNWSGGGINALIDRETGTLGAGRVNPYKSGREDKPYTHHPETGARIAGAVLPGWPALLEGVLAAARCLPFEPYIGWDIAVDTDGLPVVIEGNKNTDVDLLQVHGGLLADPAVRRFYETCGIY